MKTRANVRRRSEEGPWILDTMVDGNRYRKTLGFGSARWAAKEGDDALEIMLLEDVKIIPKLTVKGLLDAWDAYAKSGQSRKGKLQESTRKQNRYAFLEVLEHGGGLGLDDSIFDVTPKVVRNWHTWKVNDNAGKEEGRLLASIHGRWVHAKSVFGKGAMTFYRDYGLEGLDEWARELREMQLPKGNVPAYEMPPQKLIEDMEKAGNELKFVDPGKWIVFKLALNCGMRAGELAAMTREWVVEYRGEILVVEIIRRENPHFKPKGRERRVPVDRGLWSEILKVMGDRKYVLPGENENQRYELVTKNFSGWMRDLGWGEVKRGCKACHELRRLFGSRVYTDHGPALAQEYLGHTSVDTTCKFYARFDKPLITLAVR
jgi:integrase